MKMRAGIDVVHVPYRGPAPALEDLVAGRVQAFIITLSTGIGFVRDGRLRALAVTSAKRAEVMPDLPSMSEVLPGFDATAWDGISAPKGTPAAIVALLSDNIVAGVADPQLKARIKDLGGETVPMNSAQFTQFVAAETTKWAQVIKFAHMRTD